jgi:hypothetical protein
MDTKVAPSAPKGRIEVESGFLTGCYFFQVPIRSVRFSAGNARAAQIDFDELALETCSANLLARNIGSTALLSVADAIMYAATAIARGQTSTSADRPLSHTYFNPLLHALVGTPGTDSECERIGQLLLRAPSFRAAADAVRQTLTKNQACSMSPQELAAVIRKRVGNDLLGVEEVAVARTELETAAYYIWRKRGSRFGYEIDDWVTAERGLRFATRVLRYF